MCYSCPIAECRRMQFEWNANSFTDSSEIVKALLLIHRGLVKRNEHFYSDKLQIQESINNPVILKYYYIFKKR